MNSDANDIAVRVHQRRSWHKSIVVFIAGILFVWLIMAYVIVPYAWERYARHHATFDENPRITRTSDGHPGDPINVSLIGTQSQIEAIMRKAKWSPAEALGLESDLKIAADTVLSRPDDEAPVSNLFLFGRKEDLAFEQPVGDNPRKRHHVRFWKMGMADADDRPMWIGSASYDERVGLSHTTGQITHHIAADVDKERDHLFEDLRQTGDLSEDYAVSHFHTQREGHNGGGDPWYTDGSLKVGVIAERNP